MTVYAPPLEEILLAVGAVFLALLGGALLLAFGLAALLRALVGDRARLVMAGVALLLALAGLAGAFFPRQSGPAGTFLATLVLLTMSAVLGVFLLARRAGDLRRRDA